MPPPTVPAPIDGGSVAPSSALSLLPHICPYHTTSGYRSQCPNNTLVALLTDCNLIEEDEGKLLLKTV
ncbi:hypothetical protein AKJ16_DCAP02288 [Drosera capensis]